MQITFLAIVSSFLWGQMQLAPWSIGTHSPPPHCPSLQLPSIWPHPLSEFIRSTSSSRSRVSPLMATFLIHPENPMLEAMSGMARGILDGTPPIHRGRPRSRKLETDNFIIVVPEILQFCDMLDFLIRHHISSYALFLTCCFLASLQQTCNWKGLTVPRLASDIHPTEQQRTA